MKEGPALRASELQRSGRLILTGGVIVTDEGVQEPGSIVIEGDQIAEVNAGLYPAREAADETVLNVGGRFVLPGIVCLHNDAIEKAVNPRPKSNVPYGVALLALDRSLACAGVTTQFHAICFYALSDKGRTIPGSTTMARNVSAFGRSGHGMLDHYVLFRCDVRRPESLEAVLSHVENALVPLVSLDDHVPGQGQLQDKEQYLEQLRPYVDTGKERASDVEVEGWLAEQVAFKQETESQVAVSHDRLKYESSRLGFTLMSHDDDTAEKVELMSQTGCRVAEFPVTLEAARRARELGVLVSMSAPNLVRGGSLSGNVSTEALARRGLVDILIADYHAPSMLHAAFLLARWGVTSLNRAVAMITTNPADAAGLHDRGLLSPGLRADVIVVRMQGDTPVVERHIVAGNVQFATVGRGHQTSPPLGALHAMGDGLVDLECPESGPNPQPRHPPPSHRGRR